MRAIVTGAAGFVGSHLSGHLLDHGDEVVGIDSLTDYYDPRLKEANLATLEGREGFTLHRMDLTSAPLARLFEQADVVYHLAGQPGVRGSWGNDFQPYLSRNVLATQQVLEAARNASLWKVVYASSSSVYGDAEAFPTHEDLTPAPGLAVRRDQAGRRAPVRALPHHVRGADRVAAAVHRLRAPAAAGHGVLPAGRPRRWTAARSCSTATASRAGTSPTSATSWRPCGRRRCPRGPAWRTSAAAPGRR